jgi:hypothetical protein
MINARNLKWPEVQHFPLMIMTEVSEKGGHSDTE